MGLSRKQLAERAAIDVSTIAGWEKSKHRPTKRSISRINDYFAEHLNRSQKHIIAKIDKNILAECER
jgi:transcriptional regulator with XRE-family HTH domain